MGAPLKAACPVMCSPAFVLYRLLGQSRRAETQWQSCPPSHSLNFFADVSFFPPRRLKPAETKQRRPCRNGNAAPLLRHRSFAIRRNEKYHQANDGGESPRAALRPFRGRCVFFRPGSQSCRTKDRGDSANAALEVGSSEVLRHHCYFSALGVDSGGEKTKATLPKWHRGSIIPPPYVGVPPERLSAGGQVTKTTRL